MFPTSVADAEFASVASAEYQTLTRLQRFYVRVLYKAEMTLLMRRLNKLSK